MKRLINLVSGVILSLLLFTSCDDELEYSNGGNFRMSMEEGYLIKDGSNNLLTLTASYPILKVSSVFSLTASAPEIAYVGQFHDMVEIPISTNEMFSSQATIHNCGGYIVKMNLIKPGKNETEKCIIKLFIKEGPAYEEDLPDYLDVEYEIYR